MRRWPGERGAISKKATTMGVDRTGYADPRGELMIAGSFVGGVAAAIMQNGQDIL